MTELKYSEFVNNIDIEAFEDAIGFEPLYHKGEEDIGKCVFPENHKSGDSTGKFAIHRSKKVYNCFVCEGGSLLSLVMQKYNLDVDEALRWLVQFTKSDIRSNDDFVESYLDSLREESRPIVGIPYFNEKVLDKFTGDTSWFLTRGITQRVIDEYRLAFTDDAMRGAPTPSESDYRGPAAIFPHFWDNRLAGWQCRWMNWDKKHTQTPRWLAKYTNTRDFPKATTLYNLDRALEWKEPIVVCESVPTVLMLASFGIPAVSYFGSVPKATQLKLLQKFQSGVILAPDNDETGDKLLTVATNYLSDYIDVYHLPKVTEFGVGGDMGDYAKLYKSSALKDMLKSFISQAKLGLNI